MGWSSRVMEMKKRKSFQLFRQRWTVKNERAEKLSAFPLCLALSCQV
jgi:hypothetical protein